MIKQATFVSTHSVWELLAHHQPIDTHEADSLTRIRTLVEVKASCAGVMATKKRVQRELQEGLTRAEKWGEKAQLAVNKGQEDLAREALVEKRRYRERADTLEKESAQCDALIEQYQTDSSLLKRR